MRNGAALAIAHACVRHHQSILQQGEPEREDCAKELRSEAQEPPRELLCPITLELMQDPVVNSLGNTYERSALERAWNSQRVLCDPSTNSRMPNTRLVPNQTVRRMVVDWLDANPSITPGGWVPEGDRKSTRLNSSH